MYCIQSSINTCFVQQAVYPFQNKKTMLNSVLSPAETTLQAFGPPRNLSNLIGVRNLICPSFLGNLYRKIQNHRSQYNPDYDHDMSIDSGPQNTF